MSTIAVSARPNFPHLRLVYLAMAAVPTFGTLSAVSQIAAPSLDRDHHRGQFDNEFAYPFDVDTDTVTVNWYRPLVAITWAQNEMWPVRVELLPESERVPLL